MKNTTVLTLLVIASLISSCATRGKTSFNEKKPVKNDGFQYFQDGERLDQRDLVKKLTDKESTHDVASTAKINFGIGAVSNLASFLYLVTSLDGQYSPENQKEKRQISLATFAVGMIFVSIGNSYLKDAVEIHNKKVGGYDFNIGPTFVYIRDNELAPQLSLTAFY
jgi:hypothetical protein